MKNIGQPWAWVLVTDDIEGGDGDGGRTGATTPSDRHVPKQPLPIPKQPRLKPSVAAYLSVVLARGRDSDEAKVKYRAARRQR